MKSLWLGIGVSVLVALGAYAWLSYGNCIASNNREINLLPILGVRNDSNLKVIPNSRH